MTGQPSKRFPLPCLHRIHRGVLDGVGHIYQAIGMTIELDELIARLDRLGSEAQRAGARPGSVLVSFDDGWADVLAVADVFPPWSCLQPVLFLTLAQIRGERSPLPLPRLYAWCASTCTDLGQLRGLGVARESFKLLPERAQHAKLTSLGVPPSTHSADLLTEDDVAGLRGRGWLIGSHGHDHRDLRAADPESLAAGLGEALAATRARGGVPWLAWPEGRCDRQAADVARRVGFELQFSLVGEATDLSAPDLYHRNVWR